MMAVYHDVHGVQPIGSLLAGGVARILAPQNVGNYWDLGPGRESDFRISRGEPAAQTAKLLRLRTRRDFQVDSTVEPVGAR